MFRSCGDVCGISNPVPASDLSGSLNPDSAINESYIITPMSPAHESHSERLAVTRGAGDIGVMMYDSIMAESGYKDPDRSEAGKGLLMPPTSPHDPNMRSPSPGF